MRSRPLLAAAATIALAAAVTLATACAPRPSDMALPSPLPSATSQAPPVGPTVEPCSARPVNGRTKPPLPTAATRGGIGMMYINTNLGPIEIEIDRYKTPCTMAFLNTLAKEGFFRGFGCRWLTVVQSSTLECGQASGTVRPRFDFRSENLPDVDYDPCATGGPVAHPGLPSSFPTWMLDAPPNQGPDSWECSPRRDPGNMTYLRGTIALVDDYRRREVGSSYFFFVYEDSQMPAKYSTFGKIVKGMDIIDEVAKAGLSPGEHVRRIKEPLQILSVKFSG